MENGKGEDYYGIYEAIIDATQSEVILFFIIVAIVMAVVVSPLYIAVLRDRKAARSHTTERDIAMQGNERENRQQIIEVIKENSSVIASLKTTLEHNGASHVKALDRIHARLDNAEMLQKNLATEVTQINMKFDNALRNQTEMASKINKIFVKASGGVLSPTTGGEENVSKNI